jgi:adenine-specific DNA-methyltransferase
LLALPELIPATKTELGQYMTSKHIAQFMAAMFSPLADHVIRLLDPGAGVGSLTAAFVQLACREAVRPKHIAITAYEVDPTLQAPLQATLEDCAQAARAAGIDVTFEVQPVDFIEHATHLLAGGLFSQPTSYTHVITNPPYKKINSQSTHRLLLRSVGIEVSNLYAAFVALAVKLLVPNGELVAITPRSFCNGPYFLPFRRLLLGDMAVRRIHTFAARDVAFKDDEVLQENIIYWATKSAQPPTVELSSSQGIDLDNVTVRRAQFAEIVHPNDSQQVIHIPVTAQDNETVRRLQTLGHSLSSLGISVSTGPVVDFRLKTHIHQASKADSVPLIYPAHFQEGYVTWPRTNGRKPNAIDDCAETRKWLMPQGCYTLTRRFSSKEERRRIYTAIYDPARVDAEWIGFENHLNVFHAQGKGLAPHLARGLALYLNSTVVDRYFRLFNGHTQVNATDLRAMPYPSRAALIALGEKAPPDRFPPQEVIDEWVDGMIAAESALLSCTADDRS